MAVVRDIGMSGKGRVGETSRSSARKELPLSGKDFDATSHPFSPPPVHTALLLPAAPARQLQLDSLEGTGGGDCGLILIRGKGCRLEAGRHVASLGPEPVCLARTRSQGPPRPQPLLEAFWALSQHY